MPFDTIGSTQPKIAVTPGYPALAPITTRRVGVGSAGVVAQLGGAVGTGSSTITFTGTIVAGQVLTVTLTIPNLNTPNASGGSSSVLANASVPITITYTTLAADTTTTIAVAFKNALNGNANLTALITASNVTNVLTIAAQVAGVTYPLAVSSITSPANNTITVAGSFGAGRALSMTVTAANGTAVVIPYTTGAGDTTATLTAADIVVAINASPAVLGALAFLAPASNLAGVINLTALVPGASQNAIALTATGAGGTTLTAGGATFANGGTTITMTASAPDLDLTNTIDPTSTFANVQPGSTGAVTFYQGMPTDVDAATKTDLRAQGVA